MIKRPSNQATYYADMKIHFFTPCYGGMISEATFRSYMEFGCVHAIPNGVQFNLDTLTNESNVNKARNSCAAKFLSQKCTHMMFIDADIQFLPESIAKLASHDVDLVGGIYPQKKFELQADNTYNTTAVVNAIDNGETRGDLVEVGTMGTGFMLIKRTVFEKMIEAGAKSYTDSVSGLPSWDFFTCSIDSNGRYLTEDWHFCREWRRLGGKVWADKTIPLAHWGTHKFEPKMEALDPPAPKGSKFNKAWKI